MGFYSLKVGETMGSAEPFQFFLTNDALFNNYCIIRIKICCIIAIKTIIHQRPKDEDENNRENSERSMKNNITTYVFVAFFHALVCL